VAELFVITAAVLLGIGAARQRSTRAKGVSLVAGSLLIALVAGVLSGELAESPMFLIWDTAQALVAGILTVIAVHRLRSTGRREERERL
jgi:hypothetical protein